MKSAVIFIESYHSGGHEKVAEMLLENLNLNRIDLFINKRYVSRLLNVNSYDKKIHIHYYGLVSPNEISLKILSCKSQTCKVMLKFISVISKYFLVLVSVVYFFIKFKRFNKDIFFSINGGYPGGEYCRSSLLAASLCNYEKLYSTFFNKPAKSRFIFSFIEKLYDKYLDKNVQFICDSKENANILSQVRNINQKPLVIYNGLNKNVKKDNFMQKNVLSILNVANFEDRKNQIMLVDVIKKLVTLGYVNLHLTLIGSESEKFYKEKVIKYIERLNLEEYISCLDFTSKLDDYYKYSDIFVLSSKAESFPLVTLLALSYGLPVIATDVGGIKEQIIDSFNGFLIPSEDVNEMANKINFFMDNKYQLEIYGLNGYNIFLENYELDKMIDKYNKALGLF